MKKIFKLVNLYPLLLVVYIAKSFIVEPSLFDFGVIFLASLSSIYTLTLNKRELSDKQELIDNIARLDDRVNNKLAELQKSQDNDRLASESKFSTLNLGLQRQSKPKQEKATYGW